MNNHTWLEALNFNKSKSELSGSVENDDYTECEVTQ